MSREAWFTLMVVALAVSALMRDVVSPVMAVIAADVVLLVTGILSSEDAFHGFSNPAPVTVAALFVLAAAAEKTGVLQPLIAATLGHGAGGGSFGF